MLLRFETRGKDRGCGLERLIVLKRYAIVNTPFLEFHISIEALFCSKVQFLQRSRSLPQACKNLNP